MEGIKGNEQIITCSTWLSCFNEISTKRECIHIDFLVDALALTCTFPLLNTTLHLCLTDNTDDSGKGNARGSWPLGRVVEVFKEPDGHARVVKVKKKKKGEITS